MPRRRAESWVSSGRASPARSDTVENYLKQILALSGSAGGRRRGAGGRGVRRGATRPSASVDAALVSLGELAAALSLTPGSVTSMVKRLSKEGLVRYERYGGVALTPVGARAAAAVLHRHRLVETFLVRTLGLDWSEVHDEAERIEHALSDRVLLALDRFLGFPETDPHGDPIPRRAAGRHELGRRLVDCTPGESVIVERLLDQSADFLRFAAKHALTPGATLRVLSPGAAKGVMRLSPRRGVRVSLDTSRAAQIRVTN
ncbi:MAG: metal-dependent transcriptional regulator [Phycisphaeraceae bacterium]|nr:metal-dependent transcriptional regulator [Phycisphaeraceae bacterium]